MGWNWWNWRQQIRPRGSVLVVQRVLATGGILKDHGAQGGEHCLLFFMGQCKALPPGLWKLCQFPLTGTNWWASSQGRSIKDPTVHIIRGALQPPFLC